MKKLFKLLVVLLMINCTSAEMYKFKEKGKEIKEIQIKLANLGYLPDLNGEYGIKTKFAVIAFQKVNKLKIDGIIGKETLNSLKNPVIPQAKFKKNEKHIEVDIKLQVLYIVENGLVKYIIPISSGKNNSTVRGQFKIYRFKKGWHKVVGRPWSGYMLNPIYFYGAYAIHGYKSVPNFPASHGCIRIPLCYSDFVFEYVKKNKIQYVYIY
jgi:hypothetical protein